MVFHIFLGIVAAGIFVWLLNTLKKKNVTLNWWQWTLTVLAFLYSIFVIALTNAFLIEGASRAALLNGGILGLIAAISFVLLTRFVFSAKSA